MTINDILEDNSKTTEEKFSLIKGRFGKDRQRDNNSKDESYLETLNDWGIRAILVISGVELNRIYTSEESNLRMLLKFGKLAFMENIEAKSINEIEPLKQWIEAAEIYFEEKEDTNQTKDHFSDAILYGVKKIQEQESEITDDLEIKILKGIIQERDKSLVDLSESFDNKDADYQREARENHELRNLIRTVRMTIKEIVSKATNIGVLNGKKLDQFIEHTKFIEKDNYFVKSGRLHRHAEPPPFLVKEEPTDVADLLSKCIEGMIDHYGNISQTPWPDLIQLKENIDKFIKQHVVFLRDGEIGGTLYPRDQMITYSVDRQRGQSESEAYSKKDGSDSEVTTALNKSKQNASGEDKFVAPRFMENMDAADEYAELVSKAGYKNPEVKAYQTESDLRILISKERVWHVSVSHPERRPSFDELIWVKNTFLKEVKQMGWIIADMENDSPNCLHLWELISV